MNQKVHHSQGKVPFSWEEKPGISKKTTPNDSSKYLADSDYEQTKQLSLAPSRFDFLKESYVYDIQLLPPPPGKNLTTQGNAFKKGLKMQDDPFFTAYMECTKVSEEVTRNNHYIAYPTYVEYDQTKQLYQPPSRQKIVENEYSHDVPLIPLPPSGLFPLQKSVSKKGLKKQDDPFFSAYRECTKIDNRGKWIGVSKDDGAGFGISKNLSIFSCKASCSVRDDSMVFMISKNSNSSKLAREKG